MESICLVFKSICKCNLEFPSYVSEDSIYLIKELLNTNPKERITIENIKLTKAKRS